MAALDTLRAAVQPQPQLKSQPQAQPQTQPRVQPQRNSVAGTSATQVAEARRQPQAQAQHQAQHQLQRNGAAGTSAPQVADVTAQPAAAAKRGRWASTGLVGPQAKDSAALPKAKVPRKAFSTGHACTTPAFELDALVKHEDGVEAAGAEAEADADADADADAHPGQQETGSASTASRSNLHVNVPMAAKVMAQLVQESSKPAGAARRTLQKLPLAVRATWMRAALSMLDSQQQALFASVSDR